MIVFIVSFLIGMVSGLRAFTAPAAVSWAAAHGWLGPIEGWPSWLGWRYMPWIFALLAVGELIADQLPSTPSRKAPPQFAARILIGALCGATLGAARGHWVVGSIAGALGAVAGTLGGAAGRAALARKFGRDRPAAFIEDFIAIVAGSLIVWFA